MLLQAQQQSTRHARRLYFGGISPQHTSEESFKVFLNEIIAQGLDEENHNNYIISLYINTKKCFAFVEFVSIELTTACLELDGLIFRNNILRVHRANEYKPDLVPSSPRSSLKVKNLFLQFLIFFSHAFQLFLFYFNK